MIALDSCPAVGRPAAVTLADFLTVRGGKIVGDVTIFHPGSPYR